MTAVTTKAVFAKLLGISRPRVAQYCKMGMPLQPDRLVDQDAALRWIASTVDGPTAERAHALLTATAEGAAPIADASHNGGKHNGGSTADLTHVRAEVGRERAKLLRLQRRSLEGELAPVAELGDALRSVVLTLRLAALRLPSKCAPRLVNLKTAGAAQRILAEEVYGWLEDLQSARVRIVRKVAPGWEDWIEYEEAPKR